MDDTDFGSKYDRQVRLWSSNGQQSLAGSKICLVNASTCATEVLKNLVLPGVGSVVILDEAYVTPEDLASNFFLGEDDLGERRAVRLAKNLGALNPDVAITPVVDTSLEATLSAEGHTAFWGSFDCVIYSPARASRHCEDTLSDLLWSLHVPLLKVSALGFYAYLRIQQNEQAIIETHENSLQDLRIDRPWPELQRYIDSVNLTEENYYRVPYSIVLTKIYQEHRAENRQERLTPSAVRKRIKELYKTGDEVNLDEAYGKAYLVMKDSSEISANVADILSDAKTNHLDKSSSLFWILCNALKSFYDTFHVLPLSGVLPDMESDTADYIKLKNMYMEKFLQDRNFIKEKTIASLTQLGSSCDEITKNGNLLNLFVKNCRYLKLVRGSKWDSRAKILEVFKTENEDLEKKTLIYLAFLTLESFAAEHERYPTHEDIPELRTTAISILCNNHDVKRFPDGFDKILDEMCRACGRGLHNVCSIIGGISAQEVIKILTNQYIPLDNCLVFDGITGRTSCFKL